MTLGDAYWVGASPGRGNPHSASVCRKYYLAVVSPDASSDSSSS